MLNKNINKVRRIVKAYTGLSIPSGNPYMTTNGLAIPGNSITLQNLLGTDYGAEFMNRVEQIMTPTNNLIDSYAKVGDLFSLKLLNDRNTFRALMDTNGVTTPINTSSSSGKLFQKLGGWNTVEKVTDFADSLLFGGQRVYDSPVANGLRLGYDFISNNAPPLLKLWMKGTKFVGDGFSSLGLKSDYNIFNGIPIMENLTSLGAKKSHNLVINKDAIEKGGGSYTGTITNANKILSKAGKSFSVFNSGSRRHTNRTVDALNDQFVDMGLVMDKATDMASIAANMSDLNHIQYGFNLNGGYDQRYMRAAKNGAILKRVKKINFRKLGGEIVGAINLDNWQPVITEAPIEWVPVISFQEGGEILKDRTIEQLIEYAKLLNPRFILRLSESPKGIDFIDDEGNEARGSHYLESAGEYVIPRIQEVNGELKFFNHLDAVDRAIETGNFLKMSPSEAILFAEKYKLGWTQFFELFKNGGEVSKKESELEETNLKNIIPEGALHAHKHHMDNANNLTKKGIPVIDNEGEQLAEIERNEIIFTLEVTKRLEELYSKYLDSEYSLKEKDEAAIEAGKLLVEEILFNTEDRTGLINTLLKGGKINGIE